MTNRLDVQTVVSKPLAGGMIDPNHLHNRQLIAAPLQIPGKHLVETEPLQATLEVDRQQEQVLLEQYVKHRRVLRAARQCNAQLAIESSAGRNLDHGSDLPGRKHTTDAVIQVGIET
ncbi:hypothetical protein D3C87_1535860 [compost metagenome]